MNSKFSIGTKFYSLIHLSDWHYGVSKATKPTTFIIDDIRNTKGPIQYKVNWVGGCYNGDGWWVEEITIINGLNAKEVFFNYNEACNQIITRLENQKIKNTERYESGLKSLDKKINMAKSNMI